jgi:hypothetical protein
MIWRRSMSTRCDDKVLGKAGVVDCSVRRWIVIRGSLDLGSSPLARSARQPKATICSVV